MKKLTNKKGFTLIEMLVVIAIIAILVAIIIPVVTAATDKAAAATNAANLRAIKAEATTDLINGVANSDGYVHFTPATPAAGSTAATPASFTVQSNAPKSEKCGSCAAEQTADVWVSGNVVYAQYGTYTIEDFADAAESGTLTGNGSGTAKP